MRAYCGIGSRETPPDVLELMEWLAYRLAGGWNLRSGGAGGADSAFARGHEQASASGLEIYLPWFGFNGVRGESVARHEPQREAYPIAQLFHPAWELCSKGGRALHARNVHQILGEDVTVPDPVKFVVCWTRGASGRGGTGQAIRIARHFHVPVFDLADPAVRARIEAFGEREET
jgi:hypothetical protein